MALETSVHELQDHANQIHEEQSSLPPGYPSPLFEGRGGGANIMADAPVPISAGQMIVTVEVSVIYTIE